MTSPLRGSTPGDPKKVWLNRFLSIENKVDREIYEALVAAAEDASEAVLQLSGRPGIGATVRRAQLTGASGVVTKVLRATFRGPILGSISSGRTEASVAAVKAANVWDDKILRQVIPEDDKRAVFKQSLERTAGRNVEALVQRVTGDKLTLSRKVWRSEAIATGQLDRAVNSALAKGDSAEDLAKRVKQFVNPRTAGGATFAARRLARTEINTTFHAQSINQLSQRPWVSQVEWHLSGSHTPRPGDLCERYARTRVFSSKGIPLKPHPQCFCFITSIVPDVDFLLQQLDAGMYRQYLSSV